MKHDVEWSALNHAYGSAEDIPDLLERCRTDPDAPWEMAESLIHQGSLYTATPVALPLLAEMAATIPGTIGALEVVGYFCDQVFQLTALCDPHSGVTGEEFHQECRAAAMRCTELVSPLISSDSEQVALEAVKACSWLDQPHRLVGAALRQTATSGTTEMRAHALLGLTRQGPLDAGHLDRALSGEPLERFAAGWGEAIAGRATPSGLRAVQDQWSDGLMLIDDPVTTIVECTSPWELIDALIAADNASAGIAAEVLVQMPGPQAVPRARTLAVVADRGARSDAPRILRESGEYDESMEVAEQLAQHMEVPLNMKELGMALETVRAGATGSIWTRVLASHLEAASAPATDVVEMSVGMNTATMPVPFAMTTAGVQYSDELFQQALRHLGAAIDRADEGAGSWASVLGSWGPAAAAGGPELIRALSVVPNPAATALAAIDYTYAVRPLGELFDSGMAGGELTWVAMALTRLTRDGTWCETAVKNERVSQWQRYQVLKAWAEYPTAELDRVCHEVIDGGVGSTLPERRAQIAAAWVLGSEVESVAPLLTEIVQLGDLDAEEARQAAIELGINLGDAE